VRSHFSKASGIAKSAELDLDFGEWVFRVAWSRVRRMRITRLSKSSVNVSIFVNLYWAVISSRPAGLTGMAEGLVVPMKPG